VITETDVRDFLNKISTQRLSPETIEKQIEVANTTVESEKGSSATEEQINDAKLVYAAFLSLGAYASQLERSVGGTPPAVDRQLRFLETLSTAMLNYVKRGNPQFLPMVAQGATITQQYEEGELRGEVH